LRLEDYLDNEEWGSGPDEIEHLEEMRRETMLAGVVQLSTQSRAWLVA
jgi:hypothetical protein